MQTSPRAKSHQRHLSHYGTEDSDMSVKTQSRGWPGQTLQKEWWWTVTEWETALLAERGSKHEAPYRIPRMTSHLKCFAGYLATYAVQWKQHLLKVISILSLSLMTIVATRISDFASPKMTHWEYSRPGRPALKRRQVRVSRSCAQTVGVSTHPVHSMHTWLNMASSMKSQTR